MINHIAVDIGASSGRLVHGKLVDGVLQLQELHRFSNHFELKNEHHFWNIDHLYDEIIVGLEKAKAAGIDACTLGIDTWAVDYVLLDRTGQRVQDVYAYRDARTIEVPDQLHQVISREKVYQATGIQELSFNTLYQLYCHKDEELQLAHSILYIPDYLYYRLTGKLMNETTNASTSNMISLHTSEYDDELLALLGLRREQFPKLIEPGAVIGPLQASLYEQYQLPQCECIVVPTHDTASAVVGIPAIGDKRWAFISSGTWSLLGMELERPLFNETAHKANYTNERGAFNTYRFLKNIMGLWMLQEVRRLHTGGHSFAEMVQLAAEVKPFTSLVRCNDNRFLNPTNMIEEIQSYCREHEQIVPLSIGEIARCIFDSLALTYRDYLLELANITAVKPECLYIVGGGANNALLCQLTADLCEIEVKAGPTEATAIGNLAVQLITSGEVANMKDARQLIANSFEIVSYHPQQVEELKHLLARWQQLQ